MMLPSERILSRSIRSRRTISLDIDDHQSDFKAYRYLMAQYADNININVKSYRHCLADLDYLPKIKICREEQNILSEQLQKIYQKMEDKFARQSLNRNNHIRKLMKNISIYIRTVILRNRINNFKSSLQLIRISSHLHLHRNITQFQAFSPPKRPLSSKSTKPTQVMATIDQAFESFNTQVAQIFKMKTINGSFNEPPEPRERKRVKSTQRGIARQDMVVSKVRNSFFNPQHKQPAKRYIQHNPDTSANNLIFNGNEIVIYDHRPKTNEQKLTDSSIIKGNNFCHKRSINLKLAHRKSIDEIQRMQIQNRLTMINSTLTVNPTQSQGYKPKSKCWQNYFN